MKLLMICFVGLFVDISYSEQNLTDENVVEQSEALDYRLNTDIKPINYDIILTPYFEEAPTGKEPFTFDGYVSIMLQPTKSNVDTITLHLDDLVIAKQSLSYKFSWWPMLQMNVPIKDQRYVNKTQKYTIDLSKPLDVTKTYNLLFEYTGKLRTDMHGFYRSSYKEGNETKWLASTQMEPVHARKVFPCFDEPSFKATFQITINRPTHFQPSLSNTKIANVQPSLHFITETFEPTPIMSTYLVAFIVSEFQCRANEKDTFFVCSRPNAYNQTKYSFDVGQKTLAKFDEIFDYKYEKHISKMAMVAIPDFNAGAMENWGLLTYRETALLYDQNVSTAMAQQRIAAVVAHEQTHMWFGDLVTCNWWSNTWLNEGFARFFQYFGTAMVEDGWGLEQQFVVDQFQFVLAVDSLEDTKALSHEVNTPDEIADRFSSISYNKGASVLRMFEHTFGHHKFMSSLQSYLKTNALKTTEPKDLYQAFENEIKDGTPVVDFMNSWVVQPGYPVLMVDVSSDRMSFNVSQRKFLRNHADHHDETLWHVPITYASNNWNTDFKVTNATTLLPSNQMKIVLEEAVEWIILNVQQTGYYRVNYDNVSWAEITKVLIESHSTIHVLNRAQLVDDALNLARAQQLSYHQALGTIEYLRHETDYVPWHSAFNNFDFILARFGNDDASLFKNFTLDLLNNVYAYFGFYPKNEDTRLDIYNRNNVLKYACKVGHKRCIIDARAEFKKFKQGNHIIPLNLVPVVYCTVISEGKDEEWEFLWNKFEMENVAAEQVTILSALGCTKKPHLISKYLNLILSDSIRLQDKRLAFLSTLSQQQNVDSVLDFVTTNHQNITEVFGDDKDVKLILIQIVARLTTKKQIDKVEQFVKENNLTSTKLETALENARFNMKWAEIHIPIIKIYLEKKEEFRNSATTNEISYIIFSALALISYINY